MNRFAETARQSCHLGIHDRGNVTIVAQADSPGNWGLTIRLGAHVDLLKTWSGRVLLAFQDEAAREAMLRDHARRSGEASTFPGFARILGDIRARGYGQGESQQARGVIDISAPVLGPDGALAVLTCPFVQRQDTEPAPPFDEVVQALRGTAKGLAIAREAWAPTRRGSAHAPQNETWTVNPSSAALVIPVAPMASAHFRKSALPAAISFCGLRKVMGTEQADDPGTAFDLKSLGAILPHVSQGLPIAATSLGVEGTLHRWAMSRSEERVESRSTSGRCSL
jgi:Bacterial transcriptional regulator